MPVNNDYPEALSVFRGHYIAKIRQVSTTAEVYEIAPRL